MSVQTGIGAAEAASEILHLVAVLKLAYPDSDDVQTVLMQIELKANDIRKSGLGGWY